MPETPSSGPEGVDTTEIVDIKAMIEFASRQAQNTSRLDRIQTIVSLDAAVERTLYTVALAYGVKPKPNATFEDLWSSVCMTVNSLQGTEVSQVKRLHRARNAAQHESLAPDPEQIPIWSAAAERFVRRLCEKAFGVDWLGVHATDLIASATLRESLIEAWNRMECGDWASALARLGEVHSDVQRKWTSWWASRGGSTFRRGTGFRDLDDEFERLGGC